MIHEYRNYPLQSVEPTMIKPPGLHNRMALSKCVITFRWSPSIKTKSIFPVSPSVSIFSVIVWASPILTEILWSTPASFHNPLTGVRCLSVISQVITWPSAGTAKAKDTVLKPVKQPISTQRRARIILAIISIKRAVSGEPHNPATVES